MSLDLRQTESLFSHTALKLTSLFNSATISYMHRTFFQSASDILFEAAVPLQAWSGPEVSRKLGSQIS